MKIDYRKGASIYNRFWLQLKANPNTYLTYSGLLPEQYSTFTRAISKRKYKDLAFKAKYPNSILKFRRKGNKVLIKLTLVKSSVL